MILETRIILDHIHRGQKMSRFNPALWTDINIQDIIHNIPLIISEAESKNLKKDYLDLLSSIFIVPDNLKILIRKEYSVQLKYLFSSFLDSAMVEHARSLIKIVEFSSNVRNVINSYQNTTPRPLRKNTELYPGSSRAKTKMTKILSGITINKLPAISETDTFTGIVKEQSCFCLNANIGTYVNKFIPVTRYGGSSSTGYYGMAEGKEYKDANFTWYYFEPDSDFYLFAKRVLVARNKIQAALILSLQKAQATGHTGDLADIMEYTNNQGKLEYIGDTLFDQLDEYISDSLYANTALYQDDRDYGLSISSVSISSGSISSGSISSGSISSGSISSGSISSGSISSGSISSGGGVRHIDPKPGAIINHKGSYYDIFLSNTEMSLNPDWSDEVYEDDDGSNVFKNHTNFFRIYKYPTDNVSTLKGVDIYYEGGKLDFTDELITNFARELGYDAVILTHQAGTYGRLVSELVDVRLRRESLSNIYVK
jgi:uncharacterized membrane protein YgcG